MRGTDSLLRWIVLGLVFSLSSAAARAQGWAARYEERVEATQREQPHWATPLVTTNPRLEQGLRSDFVRQSTTGGRTSWSYGNTQGLQFVPLRRVELRVSAPTFVAHSDARIEDGFGDVAFRVKYRVYGSSEEHRNAIVSVLLAGSVPTGKSGNGSCCAVVTPTLELGKGFGRVDVVSSAGGTLPVTNAMGLGRSIVWNNAAQVRTGKFLWLEGEFNSTFFYGGKNDGRQQTFVTPGVIVSRLPLRRSGAGGRSERLVLTLGAGEQIALTHFRTYNHAPIFTFRLRF